MIFYRVGVPWDAGETTQFCPTRAAVKKHRDWLVSVGFEKHDVAVDTLELENLNRVSICDALNRWPCK